MINIIVGKLSDIVIRIIFCHLHFLTSEHFSCSVETLGQSF